MANVISPEEVSDLTRSLGEASAKARQMRSALEATDGPLAWLAALRVAHIEAQIDTALETITEGAEAICAVAGPD